MVVGPPGETEGGGERAPLVPQHSLPCACLALRLPPCLPAAADPPARLLPAAAAPPVPQLSPLVAAGTGKTDTAVQIMHILYHNCPNQRTLVVTHSNQALNDLFTKVGGGWGEGGGGWVGGWRRCGVGA